MPEKKPEWKDRGRKSFQRQDQARRVQLDRILIVCEDSVTAPKYFNALREDMRLRIAEVTVCGKECGSAPSSVYEFAKKKIDEDIKENGQDASYDRVYCVIDKDTHTDYQPALNAIKQNPKYKKKAIIAANSIPCFEFWILLHFVQTTKPFTNSNDVCNAIKKHIKGYTKEGMRDLYCHLKDKTNVAIKHAKHVLKAADNAGTDNPSTHIHKLVEDLLEQSRRLKR